MPASPQRVPVVLRSAAQRSPCGSAARGGGAPSLRVTHTLAISFVRPAPARGCWRGRGFGAGAPGSRRALSCGQGAPGSRGRPTRTSSRRPAAAGLAATATCSQPGFFMSQSKAHALGEACGPQQAFFRGWSPPRARPCGKVKINHGREGLARLAARPGGSLVPASESQEQLPKGCAGDMSASHLHPATCQGDDACVPARVVDPQTNERMLA